MQQMIIRFLLIPIVGKKKVAILCSLILYVCVLGGIHWFNK